MKIDKIAQKRALAEYKGKKDYERLLAAYAQLEAMYSNALENCRKLDNRVLDAEETNSRFFIIIVVLGNLAVLALIGCAALWSRLH